MEDRPPLTLRDALRQRWLLVLASVAISLGGAAVLSLQTPVYAASAIIYLDVSRTAPGFDEGAAAGDLLQHDLIALSTRRAVLQAAALANAVAQAMIDQDRSEFARLFKPARDGLESQLASLGAEIDKEQEQLQGSPPGSSAAAAHQAQLSTLQLRYSALFSRLQDLVEQQDRLTSLATISQSALPPAKPEAPDRVRYMLAGLVAGAVAGVLAALLAQRFDDRIHDGEGLARATNIPLALVVRSARRRRHAPGLQPYSLALASLLAQSPREQTVLVAAASARDNSAAVAAGLGEVAPDSRPPAVVVHPHRPYP